MRWFFGLILGIMVTLETALPALAHGDDAHFGELHTGIPLIVAWISGGFVLAVVLLLFIRWMLSRRSGQRPNQDQGIELSKR